MGVGAGFRIAKVTEGLWFMLQLKQLELFEPRLVVSLTV